MFNCAVRSFSTLAAPFLTALMLGVLCVGCATGVDPRRNADTLLGPDGGPEEDAPDLSCDPSCPTGYSCEAGTCVAAMDLDGDGVPSDLDCDDASASVGRMAERPCSSACSAGVERCIDGRWAACTAPTSCACSPGDPPRMVPCSSCGMQRQVCEGGTWRDDGACSGGGDCPMGDVEMGVRCGMCGVQARTCGLDCTWGIWACTEEGECTEGMVETGSEACGTCGTGTRTRTRTCSGSCSWGEWSAFGACMGGGTGECAPGETQMESEACGNCGTGSRSRSRSCDATTCAWGAWSAFGTCSGGGTCAPGATRGCANGDSCGHEVCSGSCTWGSCSPTTPTSERGCLRIRPGTSGPEGNNYRCCSRSGADPTGWQFCLPSCVWSTACDATTSC